MDSLALRLTKNSHSCNFKIHSVISASLDSLTFRVDYVTYRTNFGKLKHTFLCCHENKNLIKRKRRKFLLI